MINTIANKSFEMINGIAYFVPEKELDYNIEWAKGLVEDKFIEYQWNRRLELKNDTIKNTTKKIASTEGLILEICAGPGGGFMPHILDENINANIIVNDLSPTIVKEWKKTLDKKCNVKNIHYAAFDVCDIPFNDETIDVISGYGGFVNIEGDKIKALKEIYRVIKHGGMFVTDHIFVTNEYSKKLPKKEYNILMERFPTIFMDFYSETLDVGFENIENVFIGEWSNENDESTLASLCRELRINIVFSTYIRYCYKKRNNVA